MSTEQAFVSWLSHQDSPAAFARCPRADWLLSALLSTGAERSTALRALCRGIRAALDPLPAAGGVLGVVSAVEAWLGGSPAALVSQAASSLASPADPLATQLSFIPGLLLGALSGRIGEVASAPELAARAVAVSGGDREQAHALQIDLLLHQRWPLRRPLSPNVRCRVSLHVAWDLVQDLGPVTSLTTLPLLESAALRRDLLRMLPEPNLRESQLMLSIAEQIAARPDRSERLRQLSSLLSS